MANFTTHKTKLAIKPEADAIWEEKLEEALGIAQAKLLVSPMDGDYIREAIIVLTAWKNFLYKYANVGLGENSESPDIQYVNWALTKMSEISPSSAYVGESYSVINQFTNFLFPRLHEIYGFGLRPKVKRENRERMAILMQLDPRILKWNDPVFSSPELNEKVRSSGIDLYKYCYMVDKHVLMGNHDWLQIISGWRRNGKSTQMVRMLLNFLLMRRELDIDSREAVRDAFRRLIIYQDEQNIAQKTSSIKRGVVAVDEGFVAGMWNQRWYEDVAKDTAQAFNAMASNNNVNLLCMSDPSAATVPIQRITDAFSFLQVRGLAVAFVKDKTAIGDKDPLRLDAIKKANNISTQKYLMSIHPWNCGRIVIKQMDNWIWKEYEDSKFREQANNLKRTQKNTQDKAKEDEMIEKGIKAKEAGEKNLVAYYLRLDPNIPAPVAKRWAKAVERQSYLETAKVIEESIGGSNG